MEEKGIMTVDFILATIIALIILSGVLGFVNMGINTSKNAEQAKAKVVGDDLARNINKVFSNGNGDFLVYTLPNDFNYTVTVTDLNPNKRILVTYKNTTATIMTLTGNITFIPSVSTMLPGERYNITNVNGNIIIKKLS